jgi:hypothetical protein
MMLSAPHRSAHPTNMLCHCFFLYVFYTGKNRVVKILRFSSEMVLRTTKHIMIYPGSGPSSDVIVLRPAI